MSKRRRGSDSDDELDELDLLLARARRSALDPGPHPFLKRGRGRPKKIETKPTSHIIPIPAPVIKSEEPKPLEAAPKRGRGRPRKYPRKDDPPEAPKAPEMEVKELTEEVINIKEEIVDKMEVEEAREETKEREIPKPLEVEAEIPPSPQAPVLIEEENKAEPSEKEEIPINQPALIPSREFDPRFLETNDYIVLEDTMKKLMEREAQMKHELSFVEASHKAAVTNPRAFYDDLVASKVRLPPWPSKAKPIVLPTINYDQFPRKKVEVKVEKKEAEENKETKEARNFWSAEDQQLLEKLLVKFPHDPTEQDSIRLERITMHIPGKNVKQVSSRVMKYFARLYLAGLPVPGKVPKYIIERQKHFKEQRENQKKEKELQSKAVFDDSDDMDLPLPVPEDPTKKPRSANLTTDIDYYEPPKMVIPDGPSSIELRPNVEKIVPLNKRVRSDVKDLVHLGYKCDCCGVEPIKGPRWVCNECPEDLQVDLCQDCQKKPFSHPKHKTYHKMERIEYAEAPYYEGDGDDDLEAQYGYLDPNFMPS